PANMVRSLLEGGFKNGKIMRPWVGLSVQPVTSEIAESMGLSVPQGVIVRAIAKGSSAEKVGLKVGDVILSVGGSPVASEQELKYRLALGRIGEISEFKILRNREPAALSVPLEGPSEKPARDQRTLK